VSEKGESKERGRGCKGKARIQEKKNNRGVIQYIGLRSQQKETKGEKRKGEANRKDEKSTEKSANGVTRHKLGGLGKREKVKLDCRRTGRRDGGEEGGGPLFHVQIVAITGRGKRARGQGFSIKDAIGTQSALNWPRGGEGEGGGGSLLLNRERNGDSP